MGDNGEQVRVLSFRDAIDGSAGGKAAGLGRLMQLGFDVPPGFAVAGLEPGGAIPEVVVSAYRRLGTGPVAVRSSALGEDGAEASFAGQFETVLGVQGEVGLRGALARCLGSLQTSRADAYGGEIAGRRAVAMGVVVQRMVDARSAGVAFSVDPVTMRRDRLPIEAVSGLGEALVAGRVTPDHYTADRTGRVCARELLSSDAVLNDDEVGRIARGAVAAESAWGVPLDLEWALDLAGRLWWVQARPITTPLWDLTEFDHMQGEEDIYVRFNIGEMIPGAICPLTLSTAIFAIDQAVQRMMVWVGTREKCEAALQTVAVRYGHVFFNLSRIVDFGSHVAGITRESTMHTLCGRDVPEVQHYKPAHPWIRALNGLRYARYVLAGHRRVERHRRALAHFGIRHFADAATLYREIDARLPVLIETFFVHIHNSAASGVGSGTLEGILARGKRPTPAQELEVARLIGAAGGVESADQLVQLERIVERLVSDRPTGKRFCESAPAEGLEWLRSADSVGIGSAFEEFLTLHGHRGFRELDLRQPSWSDDPLPLVISMQRMVTARLHDAARRSSKSPANRVSTTRHPLAIRWIARYARHAIRRREASKSMLVDVSHRFKRAYRNLGERLVAEGILSDADLLFFLTHEELGRLAVGRDRTLAGLAELRRRAHGIQARFEFPEVFLGRGEPMEPSTEVPAGGNGVLSGKPIGGGIVEGIARVVRSFDEATMLQRGEILIVSQTDIGWSPYYGIVSGLATDLGSPMSHGAVIAREYGLPAVTNLRIATRTFRTGDRVRLDGDRGILCRIEPQGKEGPAC